MKFLLILIISLIYGGCTNSSPYFPEKPENLIPEKKFKEIFSEMIISETIIQSKIASITESNKIANLKGNEILKKYHVDSIQYTNSFDYYAADKDAMEKMYNEIINDFNKRIESIK